jgi:hypothetical protein
MLTSALVRGCRPIVTKGIAAEGDAIDMLNRIIKIYQGKD